MFHAKNPSKSFAFVKQRKKHHFGIEYVENGQKRLEKFKKWPFSSKFKSEYLRNGDRYGNKSFTRVQHIFVGYF